MGSTSAAMPCHVRSISLPSQSHLRIEIELNKLRTWEIFPLKAERICDGLSSLGELYNCVEDLLQSPVTQQVLIRHQKEEEWLDEMLDEFLRLLDMCSTTRDIFLLMKEHVHDLQSSLRRRRDMENKIRTYMHFQKKVKKDVSKCLAVLKQLNVKCASYPILDQNHNLSVVVKVLGDVRTITISIFQSLMSFLVEPRPKHGSRSLVSKFMQKGKVACEGELEDIDNVESVNVMLCNLCERNSSKDTEMERVKKAQKRLETLRVTVEGFEAGLECLFRHFIQTRVSLLNILTH
ncbi:hypothetical protein HHK36_031118 [Tetracentron sinense]|uniref:Uncharacterized protein n=1 Tax=Tetracentron sinense TaxID=13715 RepID=A0A834YAQ2_TETSI|nr:hypothetical protein HHK36_031118 [Tetracentron sinense]